MSDALLAQLAATTRRIGELDAGAQAAFAPTLYLELHGLASAILRGSKPGHTLQPTVLVHEAWLKICRLEPNAERGRNQYVALAAKAMRSVLVDHARARATGRRGHGRARASLSDVSVAADAEASDLVDLDAALREFEQIDPMRARVVELVFFGGLSAQEASVVLGVSKRTVERGWNIARAWLYRRLDGGVDGS